MNESLIVADVLWHGDEIFEIQFERNGITFMPGDCLALFAEDGRESRPYSMASGCDESIVRFVIRRMNDGVVTPHLATRTPGDYVKCSPPFGWFKPGQCDGAPFVFIATGTGISPFLSYLRTYLDRPPVECLYGVRVLKDTVDIHWLKQQCHVKLCVSRETSTEYFQGRVTDLLEDMPLSKDHHYYLCGLDTMIDETTKWLEKSGVNISNIHRECFFNESYSA
ncbi:MAG: hypothetical protein GKR87_07080 [Kiritimatiellae bacterium]|nr:hypothetical protein [Kiritimatiellia bacterium]